MNKTMCLMSLSEPAWTVAAEATNDRASAECHISKKVYRMR